MTVDFSQSCPASHVKVEHGANLLLVDVAGFSVGQIQRSFAEALNVPEKAAAFVNGQPAPRTKTLNRGDSLEFLVVHGQKGALSSEELEQLNLPREVSTAEAAQILGCDRKTVQKYIHTGLLEWRDIAPPTSSRPEFRIKLDSVLAIRSSYRTTPFPRSTSTSTPRRSTASSAAASKHIVLD